MAPLIFETESQPFHQIGRAEAGGWSVRVGDRPNQFLAYGPYVTTVAPGKRSAAFRLMLDNVAADNLLILTLDVYDATSGRVLAEKDIHRRDFKAPFSYQDFELIFEASANQKLEFRTFWYNYSYARQERVIVR